MVLCAVLLPARSQLRLVQAVLEHGADALMMDVDVLAMQPAFLAAVVHTPHADLVLASDARRYSSLSADACPGSAPEHQPATTEWVCAGLLYARRVAAVEWVLHEVTRLMQDFSLTDQDALREPAHRPMPPVL